MPPSFLRGCRPASVPGSLRITAFRFRPLLIARLVIVAFPMVAMELPEAAAGEHSAITFRRLGSFKAAEAHQAAAVDETAFYAVSNRSIGKYRKSDGKPLAKWTADENSPIRHLNSGTVYQGRLYCAHSNWPQAPLRNSVEIFDTQTLAKRESHKFPDTEGAINWIDRHKGAWWIVFAFYGEQARQTRLVRYDDNWRVTGRWTFPETVIQRFLPNSNSGGSFAPNGQLFVTGHDRAELYSLEVPEKSGVLRHTATVAAPIAGQGVAWDRSDIGTLYGIVRKNREVVSFRLSHAAEFTALKRSLTWVRDPRNPLLPPRAGQFDATRCMNPWVRQDGKSYRLYYSGGDKAGRQRMGLATASIENLASWQRQGPLFENGPAGSFDARWCVLPHVVSVEPGRWFMYYTGNAGRGSGLSAFPGIGLATSSDGLRWERSPKSPVLTRSGRHGEPDAQGIAGGSVIRFPREDGSTEWRFYYTGCPTIGRPLTLNQQKTICLAVSDDGITWTRRGAVLLRDPRRDYENIGVAGPVVQRDPDGMFRMWYSAIGTRWGYYCICYAESDDGILWRRGRRPEENLQLAPTGKGWESQMVEYPTIIREGDHWRIFYCGNGYGRTGIGTAVGNRPEGAESP